MSVLPRLATIATGRPTRLWAAVAPSAAITRGFSTSISARSHRLQTLISALGATAAQSRSEEHTSELQSHLNLVCRLLLEKKKQSTQHPPAQHSGGRGRVVKQRQAPPVPARRIPRPPGCLSHGSRRSYFNLRHCAI